MIKCFCDICGAYIGEFYPSQIRRTCSKECYSKLVANQVRGKNNPNYKHGKHIENRCKKCGKLIDPRSTFCNKCRPNRGGHSHSKETKKIIGIKSKAKFTEEYKERIYRRQYRGKKHRDINGYILVKNYTHPNRNSHNDILEHILIMSEHLGRPLEKGEIVHHIDGDRTNNDIANLHLFKNRSKHRKSHVSYSNLLKSLIDLGIIIFRNARYELKEVVAQ